MADQRNGGIAWTEETWNPLRGCSRVSDGCRNCYAESMAARFSGIGQPYEGTINSETKRWNGTIKLVQDKLTEPLRWQRPRRVFVNSMSDLFHPEVQDEFIDQVFAVMALAPQHTFQVLTKRPERMRDYFEFHFTRSKCGRIAGDMTGLRDDAAGTGDVRVSNMQFPLPNVWLGVTVENQETADERIPLLLQTPAAVRWVSMEPLLEKVDLALLGILPRSQHSNYTQTHDLLHWVVVGGESGSNARPMHPSWVRGLRDQCAEAGVPFLFKQWGEWAPHQARAGGDEGGDLRRGHVRYLQGDGREPDGHFRKGDAAVARIGKKAAGRLLDGVQHDGYPEVQP